MKLTEQELCDSLLEKISRQLVLERKTLSVMTTEDNQKIFDIPVENYNHEIHKFELRVGGVPFSDNRFTVVEKQVRLNDDEEGVKINRRVDFIFYWIKEFYTEDFLPKFILNSNIEDGTIETIKLVPYAKEIIENLKDVKNLDKLKDYLLPATKDKLGLIQVGENLSISPDGTLSGSAPYVHPNDANTRHVTDTQINSWNNKSPAHDHPYIPTNASCNKNWIWSGQTGQPTWLWGGNDANTVQVYNPMNFNVAHAANAENSNKLGGLTLDQIKELISKGGGDIMGKTFKFEKISVKQSSSMRQTLKEFSHANGGMIRFTLTSDSNGDAYSYGGETIFTVDGNETVVSNFRNLIIAHQYRGSTTGDAVGGFFDLPFKNSFKIELGSGNSTVDANIMYYLA